MHAQYVQSIASTIQQFIPLWVWPPQCIIQDIQSTCQLQLLFPLPIIVTCILWCIPGVLYNAFLRLTKLSLLVLWKIRQYIALLN